MAPKRIYTETHTHKDTERRRLLRIRVSVITLLRQALAWPQDPQFSNPLPVPEAEVVTFLTEVAETDRCSEISDEEAAESQQGCTVQLTGRRCN